MLGFNGLLSYMFARQAIEENDLAQAEKTIEIYRSIEPLNPEHAYLEAIVKMKQNQPQLAIEYLQQARILGFSDLERLSAETAFEPLHHRADYRDLLRQ
jgi:cell envelope opacity-associated protein A